VFEAVWDYEAGGVIWLVKREWVGEGGVGSCEFVFV
jgi:hypothetical protein